MFTVFGDAVVVVVVVVVVCAGGADWASADLGVIVMQSADVIERARRSACLLFIRIFWDGLVVRWSAKLALTPRDKLPVKRGRIRTIRGET
jgi:hypothetical protein